MASIVLSKVSVEFSIYQGGARSLKKRIMWGTTGGALARDAADRICVKALNEVDLAIHHGDRVGLVGRNGAGKTTLLRVLAGVYEPVSGQIWSEGRVVSLFDTGLGIDPDLTGYENIHARCLLFGLSRRQVDRRMDEIAEFTELGDYLGMPARIYSSGMLMRLAYGCSLCLDPEILLMDEWIGAVDAQFLSKAQARVESMIAASGILVIASHSTEVLRKLCNRLVLVDRGTVVTSGPVEEVLTRYAAQL